MADAHIPAARERPAWERRAILGALCAAAMALALALAPGRPAPSAAGRAADALADPSLPLGEGSPMDEASAVSAALASWAWLGAGPAGAIDMDQCVDAAARGSAEEGLSREERARAYALRMGFCESLDANGDGLIDWAEYAGPSWALFRALDANGDGRVDDSEATDEGNRRRAAGLAADPDWAAGSLLTLPRPPLARPSAGGSRP